MPPTKTYLLAPNFSYHPGTIRLGDILRDPFDPTAHLSRLPPSTPSSPTNTTTTTTTHTDLDATFTTTTSHTLQTSLFAKFLGLAQARASGGIDRDQSQSYTTDRLETQYFTHTPTPTDVTERLNHPAVTAAMHAGVYRKSPVYMITGLKIARGLKVEISRGKGSNVGVGVGAPVAASGVEVGAEVDASRREDVQSAYRTEVDVIFAYQLHVISRGGWRGKGEVGVRRYVTDAAFLEEEEEGKVVEEGVEVEAAGEGAIRVADEEMEVGVEVVEEDGEECVCLVPLDG
ncbi:hypothetical protein QBC34DRAFT_474219 [Podospora aff. communis PSN243]|uniref:Uncharacterized protein n=1 Tax=Podospora aff. communis PSN243 TaxID=3040156 RepID=A0AAV9G7H6_9PEZI|nr:hypothetical protein QBC34DRAFT_474219 [Podospora aff. communis PSN243]